MTVRPLQSAWRFSRNELSGNPGRFSPFPRRFDPLAHPCTVGYDSAAMLSRAQETRVRATLWSKPDGTVQTYCLEHLVTAAKIPPGHLSDLAIFVRALYERGDCQRRFGGFCDADRHGWWRRA